MACFGGSNCCAHRWKQRQTSPEKPVGTSVGIGTPGSAENTRKYGIWRNCESCRAHILFLLLLYSGAGLVRPTIEHARSRVRGNPLVAQTKTRLRQSHSTPLPGRSRDQLAEHRMPGGQPELVPDGPAAHALPSARETACRTTAGAIRGVSETSGPEVSPS